jgi:hypothetical protein
VALFTNNLDPERLMKAADASMKAAVEVAGYTRRSEALMGDQNL